MPATDVTVVLAAESILYSPLLLAAAGELLASGIRCEIQVARPTPDAKASKVFIDHVFGRSLLEKHIYEDRIVIGVADPMRLSSISPNSLDHGPYVKAAIAGTLVHKMCFWLVDSKRELVKSWEEEFEKILTHPLGWTGWTLAYYELRNAKKLPVDQILNKLESVPNPNEEFRLYKSHAEKGEKVAFLTPNPRFAHEGLQGKDDLHTHHRFHLDYNQHVMTALVVPDDYMNPEHWAYPTIDRFRRAVANAIRYVMTDTAGAAAMLSHYLAFGSSVFGRELSRPFGLQSLKDLRPALRFLATADPYNRNQDLRVPSRTVDRTLELRRVFEEALHDVKAMRSDLAEEWERETAQRSSDIRQAFRWIEDA